MSASRKWAQELLHSTYLWLQPTRRLVSIASVQNIHDMPMTHNAHIMHMHKIHMMHMHNVYIMHNMCIHYTHTLMHKQYQYSICMYVATYAMHTIQHQDMSHGEIFFKEHMTLIVWADQYQLINLSTQPQFSWLPEIKNVFNNHSFACLSHKCRSITSTTLHTSAGIS